MPQDTGLITDFDIHLFKEGNHFKLYEKFGSHLITKRGRKGTYFAVWAPNAKSVSVVGDFNGWDPRSHELGVRWDGSGVWEGFIPGVGKGELYKYHILSNIKGRLGEKTDPFAYYFEVSPRTASIVWDLDYDWRDAKWMKRRHEKNSVHSPISIYEVHLGSWNRTSGGNICSRSYRELANELADHLNEMEFTHVEFLPVMEHPFYGSWGYQTTGYFAPTSRYGNPQDFMYLVDTLHRNDIAVILDWVPSHFPSDEHGLGLFDGTHLYEHSDRRRGFHPDWKSLIFNYGRNEVRDFLISSAGFWLDRYHIDGLRVDAVASMLYLDYSRKEGEWLPNRFGGRENLEAVDFLKQLNVELYGNHCGIQIIAEESTAWPMVSGPTDGGGLGFGLKWDMGWMHDTLEYMAKDPVHRKFHHEKLTFRMLYAFSENFVLPLSHDEVVHMKGSLLNKMPNDEWQKFANLRLLFGYMYGQPGKKLLFMGSEFGQWEEWDHDKGLSWDLMEHAPHAGIKRLVTDLNNLYRKESALHELDCRKEGFQWLDCDDKDRSVIAFLRVDSKGENPVVVICNFTPTPLDGHTFGVPQGVDWDLVLNSDSNIYGGSGHGEMKKRYGTAPEEYGGRPFSLTLNVPPLSVLFLRHGGNV